MPNKVLTRSSQGIILNRITTPPKAGAKIHDEGGESAADEEVANGNFLR
jgi:hypothetical protein